MEFAESLHFLVDPIEGTSNHFASYFGSVLGALDVNGDGFDELLVGAPLYQSTDESAARYSTASFGEANNTTRDEDQEPEGILNSGEEGCVFV